MKILYFDCFAGISGDMTWALFLDCGVSADYLQTTLEKLKVPGFHLEVEKTKKNGITGTQCKVICEREEHAHRHFSDIRKIIEDSALEDEIKRTAVRIFKRVAEAEGKVHGVTPDHVHFHEVGAVDSIVDIVGAAICYHSVASDAVYASAVNVGSGFVKCAHGILPVPVPATAEILAGTKLPVYAEAAEGECTTPTGAAILAELAGHSGRLPVMNIETVGYGFGEREFQVLNALRMFVGDC